MAFEIKRKAELTLVSLLAELLPDFNFYPFKGGMTMVVHPCRFLARTGAEKLHFGRTERENDGLRRFKLSWHTEEETIDYFRIDPSGRPGLAPARHDSGFHKKIFGRLPLMFNQLAGSIIYPHLD